MRSFALSVLMILGLVPAAQAALPVTAFFGQYELVADRLGMCPSHLRVYNAMPEDNRYQSVSVGGYFFPRVNAGSYVRDNQFERAELISYTTGNSLVHRNRRYDKINNRHETIIQSARLSGSRLTVRHQWRGFAPTNTECVYRRLTTEPFRVLEGDTI